MCQVDKEHKILARWIDLSVEKLLRSNPEISIKEVSVEILSRIYRAAVKKIEARFSKEGKTHKMNATR